MYIPEFDQVFTEIDCCVGPTAPQAPNQNAFIERWIGSIRSECLDFFAVFGKQHFDHLVDTYLVFCNELHPHQSLDNRPLTGTWPIVDEPLSDNELNVCHERLGGLLRHYERIAA